MSLPDQTVAAYVAAICSAYSDAAEILQNIQVKEQARKDHVQNFSTEASIQELELSLGRGKEVVQNQYNRDYKRFGTIFAIGDKRARDNLKVMTVYLQGQLITNLQKTVVDFSILQDVSNSTMHEAIRILGGLQQRIINSGPIENLKSPSLVANPTITSKDKVLGEKLAGKAEKLRSTSKVAFTTYKDQKPCSEAEEVKIGVSDRRQETLGEDHPNTMLPRVDNQTSVLQDQGKYKETERMNRRDLQIRDINTAENETGGDHYPDNDSELSKAASIQSLSSVGGSSSTTSMKAHPYRKTLVLSSSLGHRSRPPTDLSEALKSRDLRVVQRFLTKNFDSAATSNYAWLRELDEAGYSVREIAELLLEDISDSPWIHFTPRVFTKSSIRTNVHVPDCAHQTNWNAEPPSIIYSEQYPSYSLPLQTDVRRLVEELCGIGGVVPFSKDVSTWHGRVIFEEQFSVSVITYATDSAVTRQSRNDLVVRISKVLANFCTAAAAVQSTGLCCDSFTVLLRKQDCLELRRLEFCHALAMSINIDLALQNNDKGAAIQQCVQSAECVLRELRMPIVDTTSNADLHYCALAAQFLCSAFLSYVQAHVGPIDPFFLDRPQRKMVLLGTQCLPGDYAIYAGLVELTCLAEMTQQPVFAFSLGTASQEAPLESKTSRYDVLTSSEDCLDTWGPGYFVHSKIYPSKIHAIAIGGGFVSLIDRETSRFHWAKGQLLESASYATFEMHTLMRIGTGVDVNQECCIDEAVYRKSSFSVLESLGTHEVFWETQERSAGVQGGQYLIGTYSQTWGKVPGITLKQRTLQQADWRLIDFLEQSWGLQVSFCTSVARRVSLRELITDLLPIFVNPLKQDSWQQLVNDHNVIEAFTRGNIFAWLRTISPYLQNYILALVRTILEQLQYTGLDRQKNTLVIAWPQEGDIGRGVKIPCKAETCWAQIIADAEDCATFAYVTSRCLETNHIKCQGSLRAWQNASKMLITEMSPSGLNGQPLVTSNAAITTLPVAPVTTKATAKDLWELEDKKIYHIKKLDSLLQVKVERPCSASNDVAHLVVMTSNIPQGLWKRLLLRGEEKRNHWIRERQAIGDHAELVVVRAAMFRT